MIRKKLAKAKIKGGRAEAAKSQLDAYLDAQSLTEPALANELHTGLAATRIGQIGLASTAEPAGLACKVGCAFCCILTGEDGGTITGAEARLLHARLAGKSGKPDGRDWHARACPALDPEKRTCRAYDVRPMICRSYISRDAGACEKVAAGEAAEGGGTRAAYGTYLTVHALARAALGPGHAPTFSLRRVAEGAVAGEALETTLKAARHRPAELHEERKRATL